MDSCDCVHLPDGFWVFASFDIVWFIVLVYKIIKDLIKKDYSNMWGYFGYFICCLTIVIPFFATTLIGIFVIPGYLSSLSDD